MTTNLNYFVTDFIKSVIPDVNGSDLIFRISETAPSGDSCRPVKVVMANKYQALILMKAINKIKSAFGYLYQAGPHYETT